MEPTYLGDLIPSIEFYKRVIEKYVMVIKDGEFYQEPL